MAEVRVMTWNVQNLFVAGDDDGPNTAAEFNAKIASLVAVIDAAEPHVVALQELGTEPALVALQNALARPMPHRVLGQPDARGIRVGYLSTRVLRDVTDIRAFPGGLLPVQAGDDPPGAAGPRLMNTMGRGAQRVTIRANNRDLTIVNCHLKSKLLTFPGGRFSTNDGDERARFGSYALFRRASEATTLRAHLNGVMNNRGRDEAVILCGDMNDEVDAQTTQILNGPPGSELGTVGFTRPDQGDGSRLWNLAPLIPEHQRFSRIYRGRGELIDHIFASHFLVANSHTLSVETIQAEGQLPSIDDNPNTLRGRPGSDHAAVLATFDY